MAQAATAPAPVITNGAMVAGGAPLNASASQAAQANLAGGFYTAQAFLGASSIAAALAIWSQLQLRDVRSSWPALQTALSALIRDRYRQAATLGTTYYQQARQAAGIPGIAPAVTPELPPDDLITATLDSTGPYGVLGRIKSGQQVAQAVENSGVTMAGAAQRIITNGARHAVLQSVKADAKAVAWMRVTSANPCAFCALLASRGAVYRSETSASFEAHSHCVPAGTLVQGPATEAAYRRWYEGELVIVGTSAGRELAITPNHPVLTAQGWVAAGFLREGDDVFTGLGAQWSAPDSPDEQQRPSLIEDVWGSLGVGGFVGMPVAAEDFHGDGSNSEVDVVFADRFLPDRLYAMVAKPTMKQLLVPATSVAGASSLFGLCHVHEMLFGTGDSAPGGMGSGSVSATLLRGQLGIAEQLGSMATADLDILFEQVTADYVASHVESLSQGKLGFATSVGLSDLGGWQRHPVPGRLSAHRPRYDPPALEDETERLRVHADLGRSLGERLSGRVQLSSVSNLHRVGFAGHVYNLETAEGWYEAAGIIVSNCMCVAAPVFSRATAAATRNNPLYQQYKQATKGTGGQDAVNAWRRHWDGQQNRDGVRVLPAA